MSHWGLNLIDWGRGGERNAEEGKTWKMNFNQKGF